ncbi:anti-sigma regulatory factor (Ser/Thr protein kinase) [Kitasatospora sp. MAP12-15]|uniref:ATP-binding protein n=1 Tax=unclassified Kitasatospora TaxID=2633591 RepID=UPI0024756CD8|nr:ATP-binding protein [Kitasatospora sp. MAP12-44]MDH6111904.1 anti-sigma regulatory factor (Ser/Thr protein kinase) [Kitasatospora sp. MAP12-44]
MISVSDQTVTSVHPATVRLPYEPRSAGAARRMIRNKLVEWRLPVLIDDAELIVSELVANAADTGCQRCMIVAVRRITETTIRILVRDGSRSMPCLIDAGPNAESGRGMRLVHELSGGHWGATPEVLGKTIHADLRVKLSAG